MRLEPITIIVHDHAFAIAFYVDVLGFERMVDVLSATNDGRSESRTLVVAGRVRFFRRVDDFEANIARLRAAGHKWDLFGPVAAVH